MNLETLNANNCLPRPLGEDRGEGARLAIAGLLLSPWERNEVRVRRNSPNMAEILEA